MMENNLILFKGCKLVVVVVVMLLLVVDALLYEENYLYDMKMKFH